MNKFSPQTFFANSTFVDSSVSAIFQQRQHIWEIFPAGIADYLQQIISSQQGNKISGQVAAGAHLDGEDIVVEKGATVEAGAYLRAPCFIAAAAQIRHGAYLRGNVIVGRRCVVGHATEVKNSLLLDDAKAGHFAYIGDSILGSHVNLGAGTKLANLKFNKQHINLRLMRKHLGIETSLQKLGALLADHVQTGCNSVINPGTIIPAQTIVLPCSVV